MAATDEDAEDDLGALFSRLLQVVGDREEPILAAHGLTMWEYVILVPLLGQPGLSQKELAARSRRDPTRLIGNLDALEERGLITRAVDAADRRRRMVQLTGSGREVVRDTRRQIRAMEADLLAVLPPGEQAALRQNLAATLRSLRERGSDQA
ncbi:MAG: MarR family transcriptional regulator [Actinobacteria bacterium]|nr:MarR family transcriptional regulator [Actinomycetota bacterium]